MARTLRDGRDFQSIQVMGDNLDDCGETDRSGGKEQSARKAEWVQEENKRSAKGTKVPPYDPQATSIP